ncbi:MAG: xylose isomerase [Candidatus Omnitrophica bacterium]|nr:Xylose isomerase [bacterium]NUN95540.1 xylose isomerase [Candidatus Omnitrophota bacterium]
MAASYQPSKSDKFTFGLWTIGNPGRDPFGEPVRPPLKPHEIVKIVGELGGYGVNFHDNDLIPIDASASERDSILRDFKKALDDHGVCVPMATTNLFSDPIFRDGAFTSNDARVRAYALQKTMNAMDLGASLGAKTYVFWGGREGTEVDASKDPRDGIKHFRDALNFLCEYSNDQGYGLRFALEAKPNEPRGDIYFATTGNYLGFIETLDHPEMVGVNPEVAHETMAGLNFFHAVGQALEAGKLFHIDLNDQRPGRYDQDFRFGSESFKICFFLVKLLEDSGYEGPRHFDAHAYRTEDLEGVKAFAAGCMRTYLILKEKAERWNADKEIQDLLAAIKREDPELESLCRGYSAEKAKALKARAFDRKEICRHPLQYERLDQLTCEVIYGVR